MLYVCVSDYCVFVCPNFYLKIDLGAKCRSVFETNIFHLFMGFRLKEKARHKFHGILIIGEGPPDACRRSREAIGSRARERS